MTYIEWMDELKKNLLSIPRDERERVASYFSEIYADKRDAGFSERQIIEEFGPPYDAAKRVLGEDYSSRAYSITETERNISAGETENTPPRQRSTERDSLRHGDLNGAYYGGNAQRPQPRSTTYKPQPAPVFQQQAQQQAQPQANPQVNSAPDSPKEKKPSVWKIFWKTVAILIVALLCGFSAYSAVYCVSSVIFNAIDCIDLFSHMYINEAVISLGIVLIFLGLALTLVALAIIFARLAVKKIKALNAMCKEKI